jgi:saccharopine dehydrogenase (NAD+, L-lysine-forming)
LGKTTTGKTCIGNIVSGTHEGRPRTVYLYNNCDHEACYQEVGSQAVSYTTGVPAMIGAALMLDGTWMQPGVFNLEQLNPDPFMDMLNAHGLGWQYVELADAPEFD